MKTSFRIILTLVAGFLIASSASAADKLRLLIVDGQNNHDWKATTPILEEFLSETGRFAVDVATSPPQRRPAKDAAPEDAAVARAKHEAAWTKFRPDFSKYDVVLSNYNGELWPEPVQESLEKFVSDGGGLVIVHAANNAFPQWDEWNRMIGLGWRGADYGPRVTLNDKGETQRTDKGAGPGAGHGPQHEFSIVVRDVDHPVMKGAPREWMHTKDELYHGQRGPAQNMHIIATAYSSKDQKGTGAHEPMVWWIPYGEGRVFTTVMGHGDYSMKCVGFQSVVARGSEWAKTGKVTLPVPENFPTAESSSSVK